MAGLVALAIALVMVALFIWLNERTGQPRVDSFPSRARKVLAYGWFAILMLVVAVLVAASSQAARARSEPIDELPFHTLFTSQLLLIVFLFGWWLLAGRPRLGVFLSLKRADLGPSLLVGLGVGAMAWMTMIVVAGAAGYILTRLGLAPESMQPSPMIPWMAQLPVWKKVVIIFSAMTVEEAFFRGWLQKRVGFFVSTAFFALAHAGYGQPLMLIGITTISLVIGYTFEKTQNLWPCIVAHGVFDAVQLFVIVPLALERLPPG